MTHARTSCWRDKTLRGFVPAVALACTLSPGIGRTQTPVSLEPALQHFEQNVAAYLAFRSRVAPSDGNLAVTSNPAKVKGTVNALASRIRVAREHARPGDIFADDVDRLFRTRISELLRARRIRPEELLARLGDDTSTTSGGQIAVNGHFDWNSGWEMPPELLDVLPSLPEVLEYKFVNRDLLLVDVEADLVVDILHDAIQRR